MAVVGWRRRPERLLSQQSDRLRRMQIIVECEWESAGSVRLVEAELTMPELPSAAGVYRWVFRHQGRERRYVGEAANLRERFESYRTDLSAQGTNGRMNQRAARVLREGGTVEVMVAGAVSVGRDGELGPADLNSKHVRCLIENATLVDVLAATGELVNDRGYGSLRDDPVLG